MRTISPPKQIMLLILTVGLWAFIVYIRWLATPSALLFIGTSGLDKAAHTAGGTFMATVAEWRFHRVRLWPLLVSLLAFALGWELLEFLFDSGTRFFYENAFNLWLLDSLGDVVAAALGGYSYWVFLFDRSQAGAKKKTPR